jgi:hypothetical protein
VPRSIETNCDQNPAHLQLGSGVRKKFFSEVSILRRGCPLGVTRARRERAFRRRNMARRMARNLLLSGSGLNVNQRVRNANVMDRPLEKQL